MKRTSLVIGGVCLAGACLFFGFSRFLLRDRWTVLMQPIQVEKGFSLSAPFTVDAATTYEVEIQFAKAIDSQPPERDTDERRALATAFSASLDQKPFVRGQRITMNGNVYDSQGKPSCYIGNFKGVPKHTYWLDLQVNRDLPELAEMNPAVRVRVHSAYISDINDMRTKSNSLGFASCLIGASCFLPRLWSVKRRVVGNHDHLEPSAS